MARGHDSFGPILLALCACGRTEVGLEVQRDVDGTCDAPIAAQPEHIVFPPTRIGDTSISAVEISNWCDMENTLLFATSGFGVEAPVVTGEGVASARLLFSPVMAGRASGDLFMADGFESLPLATLEGEGLSRCVSGCNDGNACTLDLCADPQGCFHEPVICPVVNDPCKTSECQAAFGCQVVAVPDGTPCGVSTCGGTTFCRAGECGGSGFFLRLVGYWSFDEMDGTTIFDSSGLAHHGVLVAGTRVPSRRNGGITHTNGSLLVEVMDHPDFAFQDSFTVEAWIETPDPLEAGQQQVMVFRGDAREGLDPLVFSMQPSGARFLIESEFGGMFVAPSTQVPPRTAMKLTGVFDADALEVRLYRDCALAAAECTMFTSAIRELNAGSNPGVGLGGHASHGGSIYSFRGVLDEVRIYDGAMSPADVAASCQ